MAATITPLIPSPDCRKPPPDLLVVALGEDCVANEPEVNTEIEVIVVLLMEEVFEEGVDEDIDDEVDEGLEDDVEVENEVEGRIVVGWTASVGGMLDSAARAIALAVDMPLNGFAHFGLQTLF